jgi:hypothetical protein
MQTHLTRTVRDNAGLIQNRGEHITIFDHRLELGTHMELLRAQWDSGNTASCCLRSSRRIGHNGTHIDSPAR